MKQEIEKKYLIRENDVWYGMANMAGIGNSLLRTAVRAAVAYEIAGKEDPSLIGRDLIRQGYLALEGGRSLAQRLGLTVDFEPAEARLEAKGNRYFFTLKSEGTLSRGEQESEIERAIFEQNWSSTEGRRVEKVRLTIPYQGLKAEIDIYSDRNLILAEVECPDIATAQRLQPLGRDVTEDMIYKNKNLAK